jgi:hypothetical protein
MFTFLGAKGSFKFPGVKERFTFPEGKGVNVNLAFTP